MDTEKKQEKNAKSFRIKFMIYIILMAAFLILAFVVVYQKVTNNIVDTNIEQMEELAEHDRKTVISALRSKWNYLENIAEQIRQRQYKDTSELSAALALGRELPGCKDLILATADGTMYHSTGVIDKNDDYREMCETHESSFIVRFDDHGSADVQQWQELLLLGVPTGEFSAAGVTFDYVLMEMDMDVVQNDLKIDSYGGQGYSIVVNRSGKYIVSLNEKHNIYIEENFLEDYVDAEFSDGYTAESLLNAVKTEQVVGSVSVTCEYGGITYIMVLSSVPNTEWVFLTAVPRSVFEEQSAYIVRIYAIMLAVILVAVFATVILLLQIQKRHMAEEKKHHEELAEAYQMAQQANRAKTIFLNNMSHDIRTPMNAIIGYTTLTTKHIDNTDAVRDYLGKITQSSNHLLSLINDVLDMSRIESGRVNISESEESLSEILHSLRDIVQADVNAKQLRFFIDTVDLSDENIFCDKLRLNQVLLNILSNAIKYTPPGGTVAMRITEKKSDKSDRAVYEFCVKDDGIGMSEEFAKTVFDPFTRESTTTVSGIQGTGLGMAITKNIVDMMGGTIVCHSTEHVGTEFTVTLEFKLQTEHKEIEVVPDFEGCRGLVVDDDMNSCQSISAMLRQVGMRSEWCMYGKEAVARTDEAIRIGDHFQVYIIDWQMADMNGVETARRIRKLVGEDAPIIILTAYDWSDIEEEARAAGVTDFASKPLFPSDLRRVLMRACGSDDRSKVPADESAVDFTGRKILLVEDNELNQEIATEILKEAGFVVDTAENGQIACDTLFAKPAGSYDLVLMDVQMPVMDGYEATRTIRAFQDKGIADIPIIAMTANAFTEDQQKATEAGMNGYAAKPIDIPKLFETLREILP